jgi:alpha-beta hydrolase superfamily lysophospholipase
LFQSGTELVENSANLKVPYLLLQGTGDQIVSLDGALELHRLSGSTDKTFVGMRGLYHELLHEPEWKSIYDIILGWLDARVSADRAPTFVSKPTDKTDYLTPDGNGGFE